MHRCEFPAFFSSKFVWHIDCVAHVIMAEAEEKSADDVVAAIANLIAFHLAVAPETLGRQVHGKPACRSGAPYLTKQLLGIYSAFDDSEDLQKLRDIKSVVFLPEPRQSGRLWLAWAAGTFLIIRRPGY